MSVGSKQTKLLIARPPHDESPLDATNASEQSLQSRERRQPPIASTAHADIGMWGGKLTTR